MKYDAKAASSILLCCVLILPGCTTDESTEIPSSDLKKLAEIADLGISATSGRFEIFTTPESGGAVPGPTDYATLVAELSAAKGSQPASGAVIPNIWLVSNASRPWLLQDFQAFLKKYAGDKFPSGAAGCSAITARLVQGNRNAHGFQCVRDGKVLVYIPLMAS